jgi:hypothetical protein
LGAANLTAFGATPRFSAIGISAHASFGEFVDIVKNSCPETMSSSSNDEFIIILTINLLCRIGHSQRQDLD